MSNRTEADISAQAELRASHLAQIEALTKPGLDDIDRVRRFIEIVYDAEFCSAIPAASFMHWAKQDIPRIRSPAAAVWQYGRFPRSLFAELPGCRCPVMERLPGVPLGMVPDFWWPTADQLEVFSRIQIERRFPAR